MPIKIWYIWMIIAALFVVGEIFTAGFFLLWFGIGAAVAGVLALFGLGHVWQLGAFVLVSGILFVVSRKFADKFTKKQPSGIGADRVIGKEGMVFEEIDNTKNTGRVRLKKEEWHAESETSEVIPVGNQVEVIRLDGTHLVVKIKKKEE